MSAPRTFRLSATAIIVIAAVFALVSLVPSFARPQTASAQVCGTGTSLINGICTVNGYNGYNCGVGVVGNCTSGCGSYIFGYNCGTACNGVGGYVAGCSSYSNCSQGSFYSYQSLGCSGSNCALGYSVACTSNCGYVTTYNQSCGNNCATSYTYAVAGCQNYNNCAGGYTLPQGGCSNTTACPSGYTYQNGVQVCSNTSACPSGYTYQNGVQVCSNTSTCTTGYTLQNGVQVCSTTSTTSTTTGSCQGIVLQTGQSCSNGVITCGATGQTTSAGGQCSTTASTSGQCVQYSTTTGACVQYAASTASTTSGTGACTQYSSTTGQCVAYGTSTSSSANSSTNTGCAGASLSSGATCANGVVTCPNGQQVAPSQTCPGASTMSTTTSSGSVSATYVSGWNLVAAPGGTTIAGATGPMYTLQSGDTNYENVVNGATVKAGQGYWAYFTSQMVDPIPLTTAGTISIQLAAGSSVMIGNSGSTTATVSGADSVVVYDPATSTYPQVTTLKPGQGGWAFSKNGAGVTIANQSS